MSFPDTTTTVKEGNMTTDVYSKPTDKHQYLSPSSCHPKHCFKSIPFSQAIRVKRICSTVETIKQRLGDLRHHLKKRGYNDKVIESGFSKASEINRNDLLVYKEKKINKRVPLVLTYHPSLEKIAGIVRHHWKEMEKSEALAKLFPEPLVVAFRRSKSIKDTLVRAAVSRPSSTVGHCKPSVPLEDFCRFKIYIIDHNPSWKENQRQKKESFWIREIQTLHPKA